MNTKEPKPPRWAEALLLSLLKPSDRESISGDLLEEYREVRRPALGALRANAWYVKHVLSVLWHLMWPCALAMAGLMLLSLALTATLFPIKLRWNVSLVPAPAISLLHCVIYLWASYHASQRTRLIRTGTLAAGATSFFGFTFVFAFAAVRAPGLLVVPFSQPFIFVILSVLLLIALSHGVVMGTLGGIIGRWCTPTAPREIQVS